MKLNSLRIIFIHLPPISIFLLLQALNYILTNGEALEQMLLHENNIEGMNMIESIRNNAMRSVMEREREERISSNTLGKLI